MGTLAQFLPDSLSPSVFFLLLFASFASSFITVAFGIGGGALLLAVMATLVPISALIPVHGLIQAGSNGGRMLLLRRFVHWSALPGFTAGSLLGCLAGGAIVVELPANAVQVAVGLFIIWTVIARAPGWLRNLPIVTGAVSSFLTMFFGATGLFVASYSKSFNLARHAHVATHATLMFLQHSLKVFVFGFLGFAFGGWGFFVVAMIALGFLGTICGRISLDAINDQFFRRALDILLVLISARLILAGIGVLG